MNYLTQGDIDYLCEKSADNLNMVLYGMTSLMEDTQEKVKLLESQTWFQRMANTITGKNKMTVDEIASNHEKINVYMSEAIAELYNRNCIDHDIILGLGNRLNDVFASQIELKQMFGAFVNKLNQKIISIDNFHMLTTEINQGMYNKDNSFVAICKIMSQLDMRTIQDQRKMNILVRAMEEAKILSESESPLFEFLCSILYISVPEAGVVAMLFEHTQDEYISKIARDVLQSYYFLPENIRKMKKREAIVENVLREYQIDIEYKLSSMEFYDMLHRELDNQLVQRLESEYEEKYDNLADYLDECKDFIEFLEDLNESWKMLILVEEDLKNKFFDFMVSTADRLLANSLEGGGLRQNALNLHNFFKSVTELFPELKVDKFDSGEGMVKVGDNGYLYLCSHEENGNDVYEFFSLWNYFEAVLIKPLKNAHIINSSGIGADYVKQNPDVFPNFLPFSKSGLKVFKEYFESIADNMMEMIGDRYSGYGSIYDLMDKYPVSFDDTQYESAYIEHFKPGKPWLLFYMEVDGHTVQGINRMSMTTGGKKQTVIVEILGIETKYTVSYHIEENSSISLDDFEEKQYCEVKWGKWVGKNETELFINPINNDDISSLKLKVYVKDYADCVGWIQCAF